MAWRGNPLVHGLPHIRFYAGQRLLTPSGQAVGALCVVDRERRQLSDDQLSALQALGRQTAMLFQLRLRSKQLEEEVVVRQRAVAESQAARALADAASQAKSDFLSSMSHELRTPLNSVIGFSRTLQRNRHGNLRATDLKYLSRIEANGVHLLNVINDVRAAEHGPGGIAPDCNESGAHRVRHAVAARHRCHESRQQHTGGRVAIHGRRHAHERLHVALHGSGIRGSDRTNNTRDPFGDDEFL